MDKDNCGDIIQKNRIRWLEIGNTQPSPVMQSKNN